MASLGHTCKFQRVSRFGIVTAATSLSGGQPNFARCLAVSCAATLHIYFWGLLPPDIILPVAKFTLRPSLALSYIGTVTAWHSSSGRQPNFAALNRARHLYSAGRPSGWALAHISSIIIYYVYRTQSTKYKKYTHKTYNRHQEVQIKLTARVISA